MPKVILSGYIEVPDTELESVKAALPTHISLTRQEVGCVVFKVSQDNVNRNIFNVYEEFADRNAFEAHQTRVQSSEWGVLTKNIVRHYEIKEDL